MRVRILAWLWLASLLAGGSASAQDYSRWNVGVAAVGVQYDLSGVGNAPGVAIRASRDLTPHLVLETRGLLAWPDQQSGPSTFFVPEAQLQYRWNVARFSPYVGGGGGVAMVKSPFRTEWDSTLSVSAGTGVRLSERVGITGELRLRGIEPRFTGSTAEWSLGMAWRLPSF
jgi:hypothetical protein